MGINRYILIAFVALFITTSCEEVIEIDLNSSNPVLTIEAKLYKDSLCTVLLTNTANYFSRENPVPIEDATVTLVANGSLSEELVYLGQGVYTGTVIVGAEGVSYDIEIGWNGEEYRGSAYLPPQTEILSLEIIEFQPAPQAPLFHQVQATFLDNPETEDFYMIRYFQNGFPLVASYFAFPDITFSDTIELNNPGVSFDPGDLVEVQIFSIDEPLYIFYSQLSQAIGGGMAMSSTPYNPTSNIKGAMGYFAAWSFASSTIMVPEMTPPQ